jgi:hypothetical protein
MPDRQYQGTHRHRAPLGWHPTHKESEDGHRDTLPGEPTQPFTPTFTGELPIQTDPLQPLAAERDPLDMLAKPEVVSGSYQYLKRWTFVLVVAGVWIAGAASGLGLYYWWFHSLDKTPPVFVVLIFLMVCAVGSLMTAMVNDKPLVSALAIALMSAPLAAMGAAVVLHGLYFCDRVSRCLVGIIPY